MEGQDQVVEARDQMSGEGDAALRLRARVPRRRRWLRRTLILCTLLGLLVGLGVGALLLRLAAGPISLADFRSRIEAELDQRIGPGYSVRFDDARIENGEHGPGLSVDGLVIRSPDGRSIISAPHAQMTVHLSSLMVGRVTPKRLQLSDVDLRLSVLPDGTMTVYAGEAEVIVKDLPTDAASPPAPSVPRSAAVMARAAQAVKGLIDIATGHDPLLGPLKEVAITRTRLTVEDRSSGQSTRFNNVELAFARSASQATASLSAEGPNSRWQMSARALRRDEAVEVEVSDLTIDELQLIAGLRDMPFDIDTPLSLKMRLAVGADGRLADSSAQISVGRGYAYFHDPDHEPMRIDQLTARARWDAQAQLFQIDEVDFRSASTRVMGRLSIEPPHAVGESWKIDGVTLPGSAFGAERPGEGPIVIERGMVSATLDVAEKRLTVSRMELTGPQISVAVSLESFQDVDGPRLRLGTTLGRMPVRTVIRLWPSFVATGVRTYLIDRLLAGVVSGQLSIDYNKAAFDLIAHQTAPPDPSVRMDFQIAGGTLVVLPGGTPLRGVEARGSITGRTARLDVSQAHVELPSGRRFSVGESSFFAGENDKHPSPAHVALRLSGPMEAVAEFLSQESMKPFGGMQLDPASIKGRIDANVALQLKLGEGALPSDTKLRMQATISSLVIDQLVGKERLEQGTLQVNVTPDGLTGTGQGRLFGSPASIELRKGKSGDTEAVIGFTLDDAGRNKLGLALGSGVTGPMGVRLVSTFGARSTPPAQVELDLTRTALDGVLPGLLKPAGRSGKATFQVETTGRGTQVEQLLFEAAGGVLARGSMEFDNNGGFRLARFSQFRMSPSDDMRVEADQQRDVLRINVRANNVDAKPFLKTFFADSSGKDITASRDIELDLRSPLVVGHNKQALSGVELKYARQAGSLRNFQLQARTARAPVIGVTTRGREGDAVLSITANEGGAFLSFLDIYRRMEGGRLELAARMTPEGMDGAFRVSNFILRDEPNLRRLVAEGVTSRDERGGIKIDLNAAAFTRLQANFQRQGTQINVRDGLIYGTQIGIKMEGAVDFERDRINMTGTFVPAYGVNNLFSQVPVFGPLLGGGSNEGLIAVNFRVDGSAASPQLTINPLSVIAPGFLRKLFGPGAAPSEGFTAPGEDEPLQLSPRPR